jgi:hypothetical protein
MRNVFSAAACFVIGLLLSLPVGRVGCRHDPIMCSTRHLWWVLMLSRKGKGGVVRVDLPLGCVLTQYLVLTHTVPLPLLLFLVM